MRISLAIGLIFILTSGHAESRPDPGDLAGRVVAIHDGRQIELPLLTSAYRVAIEGDMATVEVTQTFENPAAMPLNAQYLFPLNQHSAVYGMEMRVSDEIIQAVIREKARAQAVFDEAKKDGKAAALLTQHRPNMFTQDIANLMPGQPIEVRLRYVQMVSKVDGIYELVIPLIVGPRYVGAPPQDERMVRLDDTSTAEHGAWQIDPLPAYPGVAGLDLPESVTGERVSLNLSMTAGLALANFGSHTHPLAITRNDSGVLASFADGKVLDNRDLVLQYSFEGADVQSAALSHADERGGFVSVFVEPPELPDEAQIMPRELVFVLDTSGSMHGDPMRASKRFMQAALDGLRPGDHFRIIPFSDTARQMSQNALPATRENLRAARRFVRGLSGGGGTEIDTAIRTAFATAQPEDTLRIVVFLSDGYIGDEARVLKTIRQQIGAARIYAFGVGSSVNRFLLDGMAEEGRGYARYVGLDEDALEVAEALARDLKSPLLTDIEIDWGDLLVADVSPSRIPDLFAGNAVRVYARHDAEGPAELTVSGLVNGRAASMTVPLTLTGSDQPALPLIWARTRIAELERNVAVGKDPAESDREITRLGLNFSLQTKNTSFVAVSQQLVNDTGLPAPDTGVPLPMPQGVSAHAYPQGFSGSSTPEPAAWLSMVLLAALSLLRLRTRCNHAV